ncbi:BCCT family transporter [Microbacterium sp. MPKO10]|uniref:BCCT family transporter n=1 Tax=Microbacterium sp. MPKO10 TaxID=2989818 RepID=UPI00223611EA|nr:BCCT family transporter [Microbacterium sp. MPKO10]MCW4458038.1 BCCT family transporter [Microbacterium sp. MPKO10]
MSNADSTEDLIQQLKKSARRRKLEKVRGTDWVVFSIAGVLAVAFVVWGFVTPDGLGTVADAALNGTIKNFGWLFVIAATVFTVFVIVVAASRFGAIPLGKDGETPQFRTSSWIAMMFATGMGIGLIFYGVGEPLFFYMSPPPGTVDGQIPAAVSTAMGTTMFHWTLYPWGMYAIVGLGMAYGTYRLGRSQLFSSMFTSLFGHKAVNSWGGKIINILAIIATLFGSACSLGLGALQIGGGLQSTGIMENVGTGLLVLIIAILTAMFVASAVSGIERGIQWLSNINMVLAILLAVIIFIGGPTLFILNVIPDAIGAFIGDLPQMASRTPSNDSPALAEWMSTWTIFYWAWWVSWTPFVGLFIARISRGRTVRQFVTGVLLVPSAISVIWFAIFGGGAIGLQERAEAAGDTSGMLAKIVDGTPNIDFDTILFDLLAKMPVPGWVTVILMVIAVILVAIFFVTGADSASIVMAGLSENGAEEPTKKLTLFWGVATGAVAAVMLLAGGDDPAEALNGLKNITIVSAVPFVIVMLLLCVALWKDLSRDPLVLRGQLARRVLVESVASGVEKHEGVFGLATEQPENEGKPKRRLFGRKPSGQDTQEQDAATSTPAEADVTREEPTDTSSQE